MTDDQNDVATIVGYLLKNFEVLASNLPSDDVGLAVFRTEMQQSRDRFKALTNRTMIAHEMRKLTVTIQEAMEYVVIVERRQLYGDSANRGS